MNNTKKPWEISGASDPSYLSNHSDRNSYKGTDLTNILFLSKRGMSRAPLAREMMRELVEGTHFFGRVRTSSRGVTEAYDQCPIDARMSKFSSQMGFFLNGYSRFSTIPDIANADIIISLDYESEKFIQQNKSYIRGIARPIGIFFTTGSNPYINDPYDRGDDEDVDEHYSEIASSIQLGCSKLFKQLPALIS
jgi:protein-tyrosine-phosphatase